MEVVVVLVGVMMKTTILREGKAVAMLVVGRVCGWLKEGYDALF